MKTGAPAAGRVVHLIPKDGFGGVEAAARSLESHEALDVEVWFMSGESLSESRMIRTLAPNLGLNDPRSYLVALRRLIDSSPQVLVCSLWRASLVGLIYKIFSPRVSLVLMVHNTRYAHVVDRIVTTIAAKFSKLVLCDSKASQSILVPREFLHKSRVVSFVLRPEPQMICDSERVFDFVYWGRLTAVKQLPRAISIFEKINLEFPQARFFIYGPLDHSGVRAIRSAIEASPSRKAIHLKGPKPPGQFPSDVRRASFFLMTSAHEGMAMGVVEAMHLGLVPIVTPVGEIASYCTDRVNSIVVVSDEQAANDAIALMNDVTALRGMRKMVASYWDARPSYSSDFSGACQSVLDAVR